MVNQTSEPDETVEMWVKYKTSPNSDNLSVLMQAYLPLVRKIAGSFLRKKPNTLDYDDLIQAGNMGLMDAISRFNPDAGASFKTYASIRIRGSILDEINSMDWTPRSVRKNIKSVIKTIEKYYEDGGTNPKASNLAKDTEFNPEELTEVLVQMNKTYMVQMEPELFELVSPTVNLEREELALSINIVIDSLDDNERSYVYLKFFYEKDNKTIMQELELTPKELNSVKESSIKKLSQSLHGHQEYLN